jgi:dihydroorotase
MQLLIKKATIIHSHAEFHGEQVDIYIENGVIQSIGKRINGIKEKSIQVIDYEGLCVSVGWLDIGVQVGDPGYEYREDIESASEAAMAGGFTGIAVHPNSNPTVHSKSEVLYLKKNTQYNLVDFYPIGAVSEKCEGKEITEMYDMNAYGAVAFSDGKNSIQDDGFMMRALQYVKVFDGLIINHPHKNEVAFGGQMHEGLTSTSMGLKGIPNIAEELMLQRDLYLAEYTNSRLLALNISTAGAVDMIRNAKKRGIKVTASVPAMNLFFEEGDLIDFDTNLKVKPPLRENLDIRAIKKGLRDGTIDFITSNHRPYNKEEKELEFLYAKFGAIGLETAFSTSNTILNKDLDINSLIEKFSIRTREILKLEVPKIEKGEVANLTLFHPKEEWTFSEKDIKSKSRNTPFIGKKMKGRVVGVINNNQVWLRESN